MGCGALVKTVLAYILIGRIGIIGAPISTTVCYLVSFGVCTLIMKRRLRFKHSLICLSAAPTLAAAVIFTAGRYLYGMLTVNGENSLKFIAISSLIALCYLIFLFVFIRKKVINLANYVKFAKKNDNSL